MVDTFVWSEVVLGLGLALIAGIVVGFERESHGRAAGLRTTTLVCVAAAVAMLLSEHLFAQVDAAGAWRPDPARLAAGILTGMGFLGAGAIIREGNTVRGLTTAAVLWFMTILGLVFGSGQILLGLIGWAIVLFTLFLLPAIENFVKNDWYGAVSVVMGEEGPAEAEIRARLEKCGVVVKDVELEYDLAGRRRILRYSVKFKQSELFGLSQRVPEALKGCQGVTEIKWL